MHFTTSTASALVVSLLAKDVLAAVHGRHQEFHRKRDLVTDDVTATNTEIVYVTIEWPSGETLGIETVGGPDATEAPAAVTTSSSSTSTTTTTSTTTSTSTSTSTPAPAEPTSTDTPAPAAPAAPATSPAAAEFVQAPSPTTLVTLASSAPAAAPQYTAPASAPASGNKRGLLVGDANPNAAFVSAASWCWNWQSTRGVCPSAVEFIPIMWGEGFGRETSWAGNAASAIAAGSTHLMAFNEPELTSQANMPDPGVAAEKYIQYMQPFAGKAKLCSPSVTDDPSPGKGLNYMKEFLSACNSKGCTVDVLCIHVYKTFDAIDWFKKQLVDAYALTNNQTNIWVTEWGVTNGSPDQQAAYVKEAIAFMDSQSWVERQSYFFIDPKNPILVDGSGSPNQLGNVYISS